MVLFANAAPIVHTGRRLPERKADERMKRALPLLSLAVLLLLAGAGTGAVAAEENAPAVVLLRQAELRMAGYGTDLRSESRLIVTTRLKILTEEGRRASMRIPHSRRVRIESLQGSTTLADGRVVPLPSGPRPHRMISERRRQYATDVEFPRAEVGSVLELRYELVYRDLILLDPWYFSDELPVRRSEIVFKVPPEIEAQVWSRDPLGVGLRRETVTGKDGTETRIWAENLPAVSEGLEGLEGLEGVSGVEEPFADRAAQAQMIPTFYRDGIHSQRLMGNWASTATMMEKGYYKPARRQDRGVAAKARALGGMEAVYRFVRDEIETEPSADVFVPEDSAIRNVLAARRGESGEKVLLLQALLRALDLDARLVWAADRSTGRVDPVLASPGWFDTVLVAVEADGRWVYLDPSDRSLAAGQLQAGYEGTTAVILSPDPVKEPKMTATVVLPTAGKAP